jgi:hypothetical protein
MKRGDLLVPSYGTPLITSLSLSLNAACVLLPGREGAGSQGGRGRLEGQRQGREGLKVK